MVLRQRTEDLDKLVEISRIQGTEASDGNEGIRITSLGKSRLVMEFGWRRRYMVNRLRVLFHAADPDSRFSVRNFVLFHQILNSVADFTGK